MTLSYASCFEGVAENDHEGIFKDEHIEEMEAEVMPGGGGRGGERVGRSLSCR